MTSAKNLDRFLVVLAILAFLLVVAPLLINLPVSKIITKRDFAGYYTVLVAQSHGLDTEQDLALPRIRQVVEMLDMKYFQADVDQQAGQKFLARAKEYDTTAQDPLIMIFDHEQDKVIKLSSALRTDKDICDFFEVPHDE